MARECRGDILRTVEIGPEKTRDVITGNDQNVSSPRGARVLENTLRASLVELLGRTAVKWSGGLPPSRWNPKS